MHEQAMKILEEIYTLYLKKPSSFVCYTKDNFLKIPKEKRRELKAIIDYLIELNYIENYAISMGNPISVRITAKGIQAIEGINSENFPMTTVFNIATNNGIVANKAIDNTFTFNKGLTLNEVQSIMNNLKIPLAEQDTISKSLMPLYECIEKGYPLQKGLISNVKQHLEKYQTLYVGIAQTITTYLCSSK